MKAKVTLFFFLIIVPVLGFSQETHFVQLRNGTVLTGKIGYVALPFRGLNIVVNGDSTIFVSKTVIAFQNDDGYFRRVPGVKKAEDGDDFAIRTEKGSIDLFSRNTGFSPGTMVPGPYGTMMFTGGGTGKAEYFSKGGGALQKYNIRNLKPALSDNALSMNYMNKRDGWTAVQVIGILGGAIITASSFAALPKSDTPKLTGIFVGLGMITGSAWIPHLAKKNLTRKAIRAYNHPEDF